MRALTTVGRRRRGAAAGECEAFGFLETGDDLGDLLLK
jgi:hypothetical protein